MPIQTAPRNFHEHASLLLLEGKLPRLHARIQNRRLFSSLFRQLTQGLDLVVSSILGMNGEVLDDSGVDHETKAYLKNTNGFYAMLALSKPGLLDAVNGGYSSIR